MKRSIWTVAFCAVVLIGLSGCSDEIEELLDLDPDAADAEPVLDGALDKVPDVYSVLDVSNVMLTLGSVPGFGASTAGLVCPNTTGVCGSGDVICSVDGPAWVFDFDQCRLGALPIEIDGGLSIAGSLSAFTATLTNLSIGDGPALSGSLVTSGECTSDWTITVDDASLDGTIIGCTGQDPASGSDLVITVTGPGVFVFDLDYDGTSMAAASVTYNGDLIAECDVDLDLNQADCSDV